MKIADDNSLKCCHDNFEYFFKHARNFDIMGKSHFLSSELEKLFVEEIKKTSEVLDYIKLMDCFFPNV